MKDLIFPEDILSEEHERQAARFLDEPYVPGNRLGRIAWARWRQSNHDAVTAAQEKLRQERAARRASSTHRSRTPTAKPK